jgi:hypothetical protein
MPQYIGYMPTGTANSSVTRLAAGPSITSLLLTLNGSNGATSTVDEAGSHTITFNGNAQLSTGQKKFGTASLLLDGSGDYLDVSQDSKFNLTGDFTIECWIRTSSTAGDGVIVDLNRLSISNPAGFVFYRNGSNITWYASSDGSTNNIANGLSFGTLSVDTWYHIAVAKKGSSWAAWLNGTRGSTLTSASTPYYNVSALTKIGAYVGGAEFEGYIDDVRIINGLAIYDPASASITVPAAELGIVISNSTIVDRKYNSGIWSLSDSYDRRVENIWPTTTRGLSTVAVSFKIWGAGGGGGAVLNESASAAGGNGGILAVDGMLLPGTTIKVVVGYGGLGNPYGTSGYITAQSGDMPGGRAYSVSNQGGGNGGNGSGAFLASVSTANAIAAAGGGGGGAGNFGGGGGLGGGDGSGGLTGAVGGIGEATVRAQGGTTTIGGAGAVPGGFGGSALSGGNAGNVSGALNGGGGGGGIYGGGGGCGGNPGRGSGGAGGGAFISAGFTRNATTESGMTRKAGGIYGRNTSNGSPGVAGRVEIIDGAGTTVYSTPGTYDHVIS